MPPNNNNKDVRPRRESLKLSFPPPKRHAPLRSASSADNNHQSDDDYEEVVQKFLNPGTSCRGHDATATDARKVDGGARGMKSYPTLAFIRCV